MKKIIRKATIIDPNSEWNGKTVDILIKDNVISKIAKKIEEKGETIEAKNLCVSPGWMDMLVNFREPGLEYKETIRTGLECAKAGGFTTVCTSPHTEPWISNKSQIEYLINNSKQSGVNLLPFGSLSANGDGREISEMYDMFNAGAVAFTDDKQYVNAGLMSRALLYSNNFNGLIISFPFERLLGDGQIHEGETSAQTGLKPIAPVAEEIQVARDLSLAEYNDARIHFSIISSGKSVELIKAAKKKGIRVTCGTTALHLCHNDSDLMQFDVNFKVLPPLRSSEDQKALWKGIQDGTIDVIVSDHSPEDSEHKKVEFDQAAFGVLGLETLFSSLNSDKRFTDEVLYNTLISNPRRILGISVPTISEGSQAELTVFSRESQWTYSKSHSLSSNSPYLGGELKGKVITTLVN